MTLPAAFDHEAHARIVLGLHQAGRTPEQADHGATVAVGEAPFAAPTDASWTIVCNRARQVAAEGQRWGLYPKLDPVTGLAVGPLHDAARG